MPEYFDKPTILILPLLCKRQTLPTGDPSAAARRSPESFPRYQKGREGQRVRVNVSPAYRPYLFLNRR
ncbi:MAG: hypothetical protein LBF87_08825 [Treponema sp.]|nr:hypothetical protein [Treponema sp.]